MVWETDLPKFKHLTHFTYFKNVNFYIVYIILFIYLLIWLCIIISIMHGFCRFCVDVPTNVNDFQL